ncbi:hypothetical protein G7Z17_g807 [Cylindrodendrum hubeiense]|uniref:Uncharacterized protein n=1 Tax=Cylindrodendrum hubeiense TaxID=595255 RepID=A0A9P5LMQ3_9HYPO|nr:hypothetical protein G7Z17_g807 [Cylindrodendrum hubeiense]
MGEAQSLSNSYGAVRRWFRGTLYQAIVLGIVSFTQQGIWTALASMGAGGLASPYFVNAVNVITYVIMIVMSPLFAVLGNRFSLKWILVFGTIGYTPYFGALYCNSVYGTQWFLILGSVTCGFSAAALWTSEAAIAVAYPEAHNRGTYIGIWMAIGLFGTVIGSSVQLSLNVHNSSQGSVTPNTYLALIALSCLGLPLSLTISPPDKLLRTDGTVPTFKSGKTAIPLKEGLSGLWKWVMNFYLQATLQSQDPPPVLDIFSPGYAKAITAYCLFSIAGNASVVWMYWMLGLFSDDLDTLAYTTGILRSAESVGFAAAYGIGSNSNISLMTNLAVSFVVFVVSVPFTCYVAWKGEDLEKNKSSLSEIAQLDEDHTSDPEISKAIEA